MPLHKHFVSESLLSTKTLRDAFALFCSNVVDRDKDAIIHVFYGNDDCIEYEQAMISTWYELMSNFGGILSIVIGGSIVSVLEIIYHLTGRFGSDYCRRFPFWSKCKSATKRTEINESIRRNSFYTLNNASEGNEVLPWSDNFVHSVSNKRSPKSKEKKHGRELYKTIQRLNRERTETSALPFIH